MADLSEEFTIKELCEWLKTEDGKKFLKIVKGYETVYGSQFQICGLSKSAMNAFARTFQDVHEELSNIAKSKWIAAKVYVANLKKALVRLNDGWNINCSNGREPDDADLKIAISKVASEKDWNDAEKVLKVIQKRVKSL